MLDGSSSTRCIYSEPSPTVHRTSRGYRSMSPARTRVIPVV